MRNLINSFHNSDFFGRIFHTLNYCLKKELKDCESVLDLGCGPSSPLQYCQNIKYSVGVEPFKLYLEESKRKKIHTKYLLKKMEDVDFPNKSFDAVIMIEVLEHLQENVGLKMLEKAEKWAKKKAIVSTPNGFIPQKAVDKNDLQKHLSGWNYSKMEKLGFKIRGLAGLKFLRQEVQSETMGDDLTTSIRFKPKVLWFFIATLSQTLTYYIPNFAFEIFCVKKK